MEIDTNNLSVMKEFITSYGWVKHKTTHPIDHKSVPDHICKDFDDDCYDLPLTHWHCYEADSSCGVCPFVLQEVTEQLEQLEIGRCS